MTLLFIYDLSLLAVIGAGFYLLFKHISYAYIDTCSLFVQAQSMRGYATIEKNFVEIYPVHENLSFQARQLFLVNNPFLNLIRHFPAERRLRAGQKINLLIYLLFVLSLLMVFLSFGRHLELNMGELGLLSFSGALLIGARTRLMLVAAMVLADCLNYLLFAFALLLAVGMIPGAENWQVILFGVTIGLAFRNKTQELFLFLAGGFYLLTVFQSFWQLPLYLLCFLLLNLEWLYAELAHGEGSYKTLYAYLGLFGPFFGKWKKSAKQVVAHKEKPPLKQRLLKVAQRLVAFYQGQGIWHSQGAVLLLFPFSFIYLVFAGELRGAVLFCLLYAALTLLGLALMTHRYAVGGDFVESSYLGGRQAYLAFPPLAVIVVISFIQAVANGDNWLVVLTAVYAGFYLLHQLGRVLDYYFSDVIHESHFVEFRKQPEDWSVELGDFLRSAFDEPIVIMGDHLMYGKAFNFFNWRQSLRCVDVHSCLSDEELLGYLDELGVTHIAVTPFSILRHAGTSLGLEKLEEPLASRLKRLPTQSPSLLLYLVKPAGENR
jgi:hypothetical protein